VPLTPPPVAHHAVADPMLAGIIDRCLDLDPEKRPRDAGAVVDLLESRSRWRRTRPVLALAAAATILIVGLLSFAGWWVADDVTRTTKRNVTAEVEGSLARTAGFGTRAVEDRFQRHITSLELWAQDRPDEVAAALDRAGKKAGGPRQVDDPLTAAEQQAIDQWLQKLDENRRKRVAPGEQPPTLGLMLVADAGGGSARGYYVLRVHQDGTRDARGATRTPEFFVGDLSYRDYFNATGEKYHEVGRPHPVIRATHISHPFRSRGSDRIGGDAVEQRWKLNIATPVWDEAKARVIGLLILGLDVESDVKPLLYPPELRKPVGGEGYGIDEKVKVVVTDHRGLWVWHPDCERVLESTRGGVQRPHSYPELVREHGLSGAAAGPWLDLDSPGPDARGRYAYADSDQYIDAVETEVHTEVEPEIACFTRFDPYARSRYHGQDASGNPGSARRWVLVAQVDRKSALRPLDEMKTEIVRGGVVVVVGLVLLAAGLWVGLVVVLRRLEFASNG
jgi:hypothetical protein